MPVYFVHRSNASPLTVLRCKLSVKILWDRERYIGTNIGRKDISFLFRIFLLYELYYIAYTWIEMKQVSNNCKKYSNVWIK